MSATIKQIAFKYLNSDFNGASAKHQLIDYLKSTGFDCIDRDLQAACLAQIKTHFCDCLMDVCTKDQMLDLKRFSIKLFAEIAQEIGCSPVKSSNRQIGFFPKKQKSIRLDIELLSWVATHAETSGKTQIQVIEDAIAFYKKAVLTN